MRKVRPTGLSVKRGERLEIEIEWVTGGQIDYRGYVTFEYFHPFQHYPEALIYQTSDAMDRILGRKTG